MQLIGVSRDLYAPHIQQDHLIIDDLDDLSLVVGMLDDYFVSYLELHHAKLRHFIFRWKSGLSSCFERPSRSLVPAFKADYRFRAAPGGFSGTRITNRSSTPSSSLQKSHSSFREV